jgi:hypothetical protein
VFVERERPALTDGGLLEARIGDGGPGRSDDDRQWREEQDDDGQQGVASENMAGGLRHGDVLG